MKLTFWRPPALSEEWSDKKMENNDRDNLFKDFNLKNIQTANELGYLYVQSVQEPNKLMITTLSNGRALDLASLLGSTLMNGIDTIIQDMEDEEMVKAFVSTVYNGLFRAFKKHRESVLSGEYLEQPKLES